MKYADGPFDATDFSKISYTQRWNKNKRTKKIIMETSSNEEKLAEATKLTLLENYRETFTYAQLVDAILYMDCSLKIDQNIIGRIAREMGFKRKQLRRKGIRKMYYYFPKLETDN
jgi:3-methyladenine DNA glycosylase/8-oxoguanine DNA glycosylase